jgi:hypothetical protein
VSDDEASGVELEKTPISVDTESVTTNLFGDAESKSVENLLADSLDAEGGNQHADTVTSCLEFVKPPAVQADPGNDTHDTIAEETAVSDDAMHSTDISEATCSAAPDVVPNSTVHQDSGASPVAPTPKPALHSAFLHAEQQSDADINLYLAEHLQDIEIDSDNSTRGGINSTGLTTPDFGPNAELGEYFVFDALDGEVRLTRECLAVPEEVQELRDEKELVADPVEDTRVEVKAPPPFGATGPLTLDFDEPVDTVAEVSGALHEDVAPLTHVIEFEPPLALEPLASQIPILHHLDFETEDEREISADTRLHVPLIEHDDAPGSLDDLLAWTQDALSKFGAPREAPQLPLLELELELDAFNADMLLGVLAKSHDLELQESDEDLEPEKIEYAPQLPALYFDCTPFWETGYSGSEELEAHIDAGSLLPSLQVMLKDVSHFEELDFAIYQRGHDPARQRYLSAISREPQRAAARR